MEARVEVDYYSQLVTLKQAIPVSSRNVTTLVFGRCETNQSQVSTRSALTSYVSLVGSQLMNLSARLCLVHTQYHSTAVSQ